MKKAFTLLELVAAIVIIAIMGVISTKVSIDAYRAGEEAAISQELEDEVIGALHTVAAAMRTAVPESVRLREQVLMQLDKDDKYIFVQNIENANLRSCKDGACERLHNVTSDLAARPNDFSPGNFKAVEFALKYRPYGENATSVLDTKCIMNSIVNLKGWQNDPAFGRVECAKDWEQARALARALGDESRAREFVYKDCRDGKQYRLPHRYSATLGNPPAGKEVLDNACFMPAANVLLNQSTHLAVTNSISFLGRTGRVNSSYADVGIKRGGVFFDGDDKQLLYKNFKDEDKKKILDGFLAHHFAPYSPSDPAFRYCFDDGVSFVCDSLRIISREINPETNTTTVLSMPFQSLYQVGKGVAANLCCNQGLLKHDEKTVVSNQSLMTHMIFTTPPTITDDHGTNAPEKYYYASIFDGSKIPGGTDTMEQSCKAAGGQDYLNTLAVVPPTYCDGNDCSVLKNPLPTFSSQNAIAARNRYVFNCLAMKVPDGATGKDGGRLSSCNERLLSPEFIEEIMDIDACVDGETPGEGSSANLAAECVIGELDYDIEEDDFKGRRQNANAYDTSTLYSDILPGQILHASRKKLDEFNKMIHYKEPVKYSPWYGIYFRGDNISASSQFLEKDVYPARLALMTAGGLEQAIKDSWAHWEVFFNTQKNNFTISNSFDLISAVQTIELHNGTLYSVVLPYTNYIKHTGIDIEYRFRAGNSADPGLHMGWIYDYKEKAVKYADARNYDNPYWQEDQDSPCVYFLSQSFRPKDKNKSESTYESVWHFGYASCYNHDNANSVYILRYPWVRQGVCQDLFYDPSYPMKKRKNSAALMHEKLAGANVATLARNVSKFVISDQNGIRAVTLCLTKQRPAFSIAGISIKDVDTIEVCKSEVI